MRGSALAWVLGGGLLAAPVQARQQSYLELGGSPHAELTVGKQISVTSQVTNLRWQKNFRKYKNLWAGASLRVAQMDYRSGGARKAGGLSSIGASAAYQYDLDRLRLRGLRDLGQIQGTLVAYPYNRMIVGSTSRRTLNGQVFEQSSLSDFTGYMGYEMNLTYLRDYSHWPFRKGYRSSYGRMMGHYGAFLSHGKTVFTQRRDEAISSRGERYSSSEEVRVGYEALSFGLILGLSL